jgi:hypothetical protein
MPSVSNISGTATCKSLIVFGSHAQEAFPYILPTETSGFPVPENHYRLLLRFASLGEFFWPSLEEEEYLPHKIEARPSFGLATYYTDLPSLLYDS